MKRTVTQKAKFEQAAREAGCTESAAQFEDDLKKIASSPPQKRDDPKPRKKRG